MKKWYDNSLWHKTFLDLWSIPHFLYGILIGAITILIQADIILGLILLIISAILWEFFEIRMKWIEVTHNRVTDVLLAFTGYVIIIYLMNDTNNVAAHFELFYISVALYIGSNLLGYIAARKRKKS